jgi:hypothetical protein
MWNGVLIGWRFGGTDRSIELSVHSFKPEDLVNATEEIIRDKKYAEHVKKASQIFRDLPESAAGRAAPAIDVILKYGGDHLRSKAADMPFYTNSSWQMSFSL